MPASDNLQISLSAADIQKINDAIDTLEALLAPVLITLTGKEIQRLPKASDASLPFIQKALDLAELHPGFAPGYVDIAGLRLDLAAWEQMQGFVRRLQPITTNLTSTAVKLGSESYVTSLAFYSSTQLAAKQGISGAQDAERALKTRFEAQGKPKKKPTA